MNLLIEGYRFDLTCHACPEQYDVYDDEGTQIAYLRLRHGKFTVSCPDYGGDVVYETTPRGDGIFQSTNERIIHLKESVLRIQKWIIEQKFKPIQWDNE